jgi:hypothetical protein
VTRFPSVAIESWTTSTGGIHRRHPPLCAVPASSIAVVEHRSRSNEKECKTGRCQLGLRTTCAAVGHASQVMRLEPRSHSPHQITSDDADIASWPSGAQPRPA